MKVLKTTMAGLLALSAASLANAQTVVHITGSTAFRNATVTAITNILQPGFTFGYAGTSFTGANQHIFTGTTVTNAQITVGIPVIIKTSWSGATAGIQTVSQQIPISTWLTNTTPQSAGGSASAPANYDPPAVPEVAMNDGIQATTPFTSPVLTATNVGVVGFKWVRNVGSPAGLTNVTPFLAQALWANGSLPLALFTGLTNDQTNIVWAIGRDPDSGTRKTAFAESGIGVFSSVLQYQPTNVTGHVIDRTGAGAGPITGQQPWPATTINGIPFGVGEAGYGSGGDLAQAMKTVTLGTNFTYLTYLGLSDATSAISGGASELSYNGIPFNNTSIREGLYTFWAYETLAYRNNYGTVDANGKKVADLLAGRITTVEASLAGEKLSDMHATRAVEGGVVTPNY